MSDTYSRQDFSEDTQFDEELKEPRKYKVLLHNDDYTTMDFVVRILRGVFCKSEVEAMRIMLAVHENNVGVCGVYPAEIAEIKVVLVHTLAREEGFPLKSSMEEV
jgi:ATP-dependent Clp protease adaptor protein ClpS